MYMTLFHFLIGERVLAACLSYHSSQNEIWAPVTIIPEPAIIIILQQYKIMTTIMPLLHYYIWPHSVACIHYCHYDDFCRFQRICARCEFYKVGNQKCNAIVWIVNFGPKCFVWFVSFMPCVNKWFCIFSLYIIGSNFYSYFSHNSTIGWIMA